MERLRWDAQTLLGIRLTGRQVEALECYEHELLEWNERFNLTAIRDPESIRVKHFLDSFSCILAFREATPARLVDVGTGAGFPGLALKILLPSMRLTLVESVGKKAEFCEHMVYNPSQVQKDLFNRIEARNAQKRQAELASERERVSGWFAVYNGIASQPAPPPLPDEDFNETRQDDGPFWG